MAQFRGTIEGARGGVASRLGHKGSGIKVTANGWDDGVRVYADDRDGRDHFTVIRTGGSNGGAETVIAEWDNGRPTITATERLGDAIRRAFPAFETDDDVNGGDLVDFVAEWLRGEAA